MFNHIARRPRRRDPIQVFVALVAAVFFIPACGPLDEEDSPKSGGPLVANFDQDKTSGAPGVTVQFSDTSSGDVTEYSWDFGSLGTSNERNPLVQFDELGSYSVSLTVSGPAGRSTVDKPDLISVSPGVIADMMCAPTSGYAPLEVTCTDASENADSWAWDFGDGGFSTEQNPVHIFTGDGPFSVELTASGPSGSDTQGSTINARLLEILGGTTGSAPFVATFTPDTKGLPGDIAIWVIDGTSITVEPDEAVEYPFKRPGTYTVKLSVLTLTTPLFFGEREIEVVVGWGEASAKFFPSVSGGSGPLTVQLIDDSEGALETWHWVFGDGDSCVFPKDPDAPTDPPPPPTCTSASPFHTYQAVGSYDVKLTVTGPAADPTDEPISSETSGGDHVRVFIVDPSFEGQTANTPIDGGPLDVGWEHLRPSGAVAPADHLALSEADDADSEAEGADIGMPSDGTKWAVLDGLGTDGSSPVEGTENGIRQVFMHPPGSPVLELDYALLYNESPASPSLDAVVTTVSDGTTTIEIPSSRATPATPYAGQSLRYPTRDDSIVRTTPRLTASINLAKAFETSTSLTRFTLTIRTANGENDLRSPRAYVDNIRFSAPVADLPVGFRVATDPIIAGRGTEFIDESCPDVDEENDACLAAVSWLWDFGTHTLQSPPTSSGSGEQSPTYVFPESGSFDVRLIARLSDAEGTAKRLKLTVLEEPLAVFEVVSPEPHLVDTYIEFADDSTSDFRDPIASWNWDFGGWDSSSLQAPLPIKFLQIGDFVVSLTITTESGATSTATIPISILLVAPPEPEGG